MFGYIAGGAAIGAATAGVATGVSAAGGGAMLTGASAGAMGGVGFNGLATGWDGQAMLQGAAFGAISGLVGGGLGAAIGGGWGALAGGGASNLTGQLLYNGGNFSQVDLGSVGFSGALSFGMYHGISYASYQLNKDRLNYGSVTYKQFSKINTAYQRSRFWKKEYGVYLNVDGSARFVPRNDRHKFSVTFDDWGSGDYGSAHTHWAKANVEWVDVGGTGTRIQGYILNKTYPPNSYSFKTVAGFHSPADYQMPGYSLVVGRETATYLPNGGLPWHRYLVGDPFIRYFLFPWLNFNITMMNKNILTFTFFSLMLFTQSVKSQCINDFPITMNFFIAHGELGGTNEGLIVFYENDTLKAKYVKYNNTTYGMSLCPDRIIEFYRDNQDNYVVVKRNWILGEAEISYIKEILPEFAGFKSHGFSNAPEHYTILTNHETTVVIDSTGQWNKFLEVKKKLNIY